MLEKDWILRPKMLQIISEIERFAENVLEDMYDKNSWIESYEDLKKKILEPNQNLPDFF